MAPSAVAAPDLSGLIELARDPQLDLKPVVLRVQTDLFLAAPIRDRAALEAFALLATGLIPIVDEETALVVARKLAPCPDTPQVVLARLAERGGAIARAVLETAETLSPMVIDAAVAAGFDIGPAIAARTPEPSSTDMDAMRGTEAEVGSENPPPGSIAEARSNPDFAKRQLARADMPAADLAPLWLHADERQRAAISEAIGATSALRPSPAAPRGLDRTLTDLASAHDVPAFVAALSSGLGLPSNFLAAAPDPVTRYDLLTLAMRAADLCEADAVFVFLTLNETVGRSVERVFELAKLYRTTTRATARDLLAAILDVTLPERGASGTHQPYTAPDSARPRLSAATERAMERAIAPHRIRRSG